MKLHTFFLVFQGQRVDLPLSIDSAAGAQEHAQRYAERVGKPVMFFSTTLLGEVRPAPVVTQLDVA